MSYHREAMARLGHHDGAQVDTSPKSWQVLSDARNRRLRRTCRTLMYGEEAARQAGDHVVADQRRAEFLATVKLTRHVRQNQVEMSENLTVFQIHYLRLQAQAARDAE